MIKIKVKFADLKNKYLSHDEEIKNLLVEINDNASKNILNNYNYSQKIQIVQTDLNNNNNEDNIKLNNYEEIFKKINDCENEYVNYINLLNKYGKFIEEINNKIVNNYIINNNNNNNKDNLLNELFECKKENEKLKEKYEKIKKKLNYENSNFLDEVLSNEDDIFLEEKYTNSQVEILKNELKNTKEEKNKLENKIKNFEKKFGSFNLDNNLFDKYENLQELKLNFEKLVENLQLIGKIKDYVIKIFKLLEYDEKEIKNILDKKGKNLFDVFK